VSGCVVFDAAKNAGSAAGKPCGGLEARLNFAWFSVQDSGTKEQDDPRKRPRVSSFCDDHRAINGLPAMAMGGDERAT
jgi:hypothetical protein